MSHRVNSEGFRLGTSRFWKSELFSSYVSNFIQKFLAIYLLLKKKLSSFFFKIVFFKIIFLKSQKVLVLVNTYKVLKKITNSNFRKSLVFNKNNFNKKDFNKNQIKTMTLVLPRIRKNESNFTKFLSLKELPLSKTPSDPQLKPLRTRKGLFSINSTRLTFFNFSLERFLNKTLTYPVEVRLKNIFSFKKKYTVRRKINNSPLKLSREVYNETKRFWKLKRFLYLKDAINIISLSFFYQKSELLASYLSDIVKFRRKFFLELKNVKSLLPYFKKHYFIIHGASLKINVLGKLFGQRKRRFRCFTLKEGLKFSTQDIRVNLSYSLAHSWNVFGSFGIKVWIYRSIVKHVTHI